MDLFITQGIYVIAKLANDISIEVAMINNRLRYLPHSMFDTENLDAAPVVSHLAKDDVMLITFDTEWLFPDYSVENSAEPPVLLIPVNRANSEVDGEMMGQQSGATKLPRPCHQPALMIIDLALQRVQADGTDRVLLRLCGQPLHRIHLVAVPLGEIYVIALGVNLEEIGGIEAG